MVVVVGAQSESSTTEVVGAYNRRKRNKLFLFLLIYNIYQKPKSLVVWVGET